MAGMVDVLSKAAGKTSGVSGVRNILFDTLANINEILK